jgi:hypothetical protein
MLEEIYKKTLLLVNSVTRLSGICYKYHEEPTEEVGEEMIKIIDNCEEKFLKVKEEVVKMVQDVEKKKQEVEKETNGVEGVQTKNGFLIKE